MESGLNECSSLEEDLTLLSSVLELSRKTCSSSHGRTNLQDILETFPLGTAWLALKTMNELSGWCIQCPGFQAAKPVSPFIHQACRIKGEIPGIHEVAYFSLHLEGLPAIDLWFETGTTEVYQQPCLCAVSLGWWQCLFISVLSSWCSMNLELSLPLPLTSNSSLSSLYSQLPLNVSYPWLHLNNTHSVSFWWCFWVWHLFWILLLFWKELSKFLGHLGSHLNQMIKLQRLLFQIADDSRQLWDSRESS